MGAILIRTHSSASALVEAWLVGKDFMDRENRESMEEIHLRILRVTDDLRVVQRELNCAAMQAPTDPELMEALPDPPHIEPLHVLNPPPHPIPHFLSLYAHAAPTH